MVIFLLAVVMFVSTSSYAADFYYNPHRSELFSQVSTHMLFEVPKSKGDNSLYDINADLRYGLLKYLTVGFKLKYKYQELFNKNLNYSYKTDNNLFVALEIIPSLYRNIAKDINLDFAFSYGYPVLFDKNNLALLNYRVDNKQKLDFTLSFSKNLSRVLKGEDMNAAKYFINTRLGFSYGINDFKQNFKALFLMGYRLNVVMAMAVSYEVDFDFYKNKPFKPIAEEDYFVVKTDDYRLHRVGYRELSTFNHKVAFSLISNFSENIVLLLGLNYSYDIYKQENGIGLDLAIMAGRW